MGTIKYDPGVRNGDLLVRIMSRISIRSTKMNEERLSTDERGCSLIMEPLPANHFYSASMREILSFVLFVYICGRFPTFLLSLFQSSVVIRG